MGWYDAIKDAIAVAQKADNIELTKQLLSLQGEMLDLQKQNNELREKVRELMQSADIEKSLVFHNNGYFKKSDVGEEDGPFCSVCWDVDHKLVRMLTGQFGIKSCQHCSSGVRKKR